MAFRLHGTVLPDGDDRDVFVVDGRISFDHDGDAETALDGGFVLPGLVDAHAHLALASPAPPNAPPGEQVRASARAQLEAGVLALREPGSPNRESTGLGPAEGLPRVFPAGRFLAPPGGYIPGLAREIPAGSLPEAAVEELRAGAGGWAKVIGDRLSPGSPFLPNFPPEILAEAARRVHDEGGRIAIHVWLPDVLDAAIDAGFDSLEHGTNLTEDRVARIADRDLALVPTMSIYGMVGGMLRQFGMPDEELDRLQRAVERLPEMLQLANEAGVTILAGTDAGMGPHGMVREEIRLLAEAGVPLERALGAGSWTARGYLGLPGIEEGAPADLVAFERDPRADLSVLAEPSVIVLDGRRVR